MDRDPRGFQELPRPRRRGPPPGVVAGTLIGLALAVLFWLATR